MTTAWCRLSPPRITYSGGQLWKLCSLQLRYSHAQDFQMHRCYNILEVSPESSDEDVRESYLRLAKMYHPDSSSKTADGVRFSLIEDAYRKVMSDRRSSTTQGKASEKPNVEEERKLDEDIEHVAPQHRQYLSYEGKGYGTPSQRQKQYGTLRAARAYENVHDYQTQQIAAQYETRIVRKDKEATRKRTVRSAIDRLVEDLIQESMAKGEFKNLKGMGKPLKTSYDYNPMIDSTTHNLNKIMIQNGYAPEWIMQERDIKSSIQEARQTLLEDRAMLGEPLNVAAWERRLDAFSEEMVAINKKVDMYNLVTPILRNQMVQYNTDREVAKIMAKYEQLREAGGLPQKKEKESKNIFTPVSFAEDERISLAVVWRELKALFRSL